MWTAHTYFLYTCFIKLGNRVHGREEEENYLTLNSKYFKIKSNK